jgi:hypothetical protein
MPLLSKESRRQQSLLEVDALSAELEHWYEDWTQRDVHGDGTLRGQYRTQLQAVYSEVKAAAAALRQQIASTSVAGHAGDVYSAFSRTEREILWLWRVWYFFRDKFEQRADSRFRDILRAADEVVWSCHRPFFPARVSQVPLPAPLPYIKADFSPSALRQDQRQALDRKDSDFLVVKEAFRDLPVPILALPITVVRNPWALVLIGHEAGHILEPFIAPDFNATFSAAVMRGADKADCSEEDQEVWGGWSDEIFADVYSVLTMGPWAVWAIAQFEAGDDESMGKRRFVYPAPCVRLRLIAELASRFGMSAEMPPAPAHLPEETMRDDACVATVANEIVSLSAIKSLASALDFSRQLYEPRDELGRVGEVEQWKRHLGNEKAAQPAVGLVRTARIAAAGTAKAWSETVFTNDSEETRTALRELSICRIAVAGPKGVRSALSIARPAAEPGQSLLRTVRQADEVIRGANASTH